MKRRDFLKTLALSSAGCFTVRAVETPSKPNILLLYTDDQTFDSIRALGNSEIQTPNLDRLTASGTVFRSCYNQGGWHGAVCVASRTMLNTGRFLWEACAIEKSLKAEAEQNRLWPQLMRQAGYRTCMSGKWHITGVTPANLFDETRNVRPGGMPTTCDAAYERPKEGEPDLWQPWDESRGGHGHHEPGQPQCYIEAADPDTAISANYVRCLIISGKIPRVKCEKKYLIDIDPLRDYLAKCIQEND